MAEISKLYRSIISPGIAEVYSNVKAIPGFLPVGFNPHQDLEPVSPPEGCVTFLVRNLPRWQSHPAPGFGSMRGEPQGDMLHREFTLGGLVKARIELRGLRDRPTITVNKPYYRFGRLRIGDFCPPGIHLRDVLSVRLIRGGYELLHCAAFGVSGEGVLIVGLPGIGKSTVLFEALKQGFQYLTDDVIIVDSDGYLYSCPGVSSFACDIERIRKFYHYDKVGGLRSWRLSFLSKVPPIAILLGWPYIDILSFFPQVECITHVKPRSIFILTEGEKRIEKLSPAEALRMLVTMNRHLLAYHENRMLLTYSLLNPWLDIPEIMHTEEKLLQKLVDCSACFLCVAPSPDEYFNLIQQHI